MNEDLNINDDVKVLKLKVLKENLKQNWNLDTDIWNEEFPHDYRFEDSYLQLSFILRDFNIDELKHLIYITDLFNIRNYSHDISTLINNYNHWMLGVDLVDQLIAYYRPKIRCRRT